MIKRFKMSVLVGVLFSALFFSPKVGLALTKAELQVKIKDLSAQVKILQQLQRIEFLSTQVKTLQEQLAKLLGAKTEQWCYNFNKNIGFGDKGVDVSALISAFKKEKIEILNENDSYGKFLAEAVSKFQEKYKNDILIPYGLKKGTGYLGVSTRAKLNKLYGCKKEIVQSAELMRPIGGGGPVLYSSSGGGSLESGADTGATGTSSLPTININSSKTIKAVNKNIFGTVFSQLGREQWRESENLSSQNLKNLFKEISPTVITIENSQMGLPFYKESTGPKSGRLGTVATLEKFNIASDPVGKNLLDYLKLDPFYNQGQTPTVNYDDVLQFVESYNASSTISLRIPIIFTAQSGAYKDMKVNLSPETGANLIHYLNDSVTTELGALRSQNGHPAPYNVKRFVLGNEFWSNIQNGTGLTTDQVVSQIKAFSVAMKAADPTIKLGINLVDDAYPDQFFKPNSTTTYATLLGYNDAVLSQVSSYIDFVTFHRYGYGVSTGGINNLSSDEWKHALALPYFSEKYDVAGRLKNIARKYKSDMEVGIDEFSGNLGTLGGAIYNTDYISSLLNNDYAYATNHNSGLFEPATFYGLIKVAEKNDEPSVEYPYSRNPNFYVLKMFTNCFGDSLVETVTSKLPTFDTVAVEWPSYYNWPAEKDIPSIKAVASVKGTKLYLMTINRSLDSDIKMNVILDQRPNAIAKIYTLKGPAISSTNIEDVGSVRIETSLISNASKSFDYTFGKHSVTVLEFEMDLAKNPPAILPSENVFPTGSIKPIVAPQPSVTVLYPNGGETITTGSLMTITWSTTAYRATDYLKLILEKDGVFVSNIGYVLNTGSYEITVPTGLSGSGYKIKAGEGTVFDYSDESFNFTAGSGGGGGGGGGAAQPTINILYPNGGESLAQGSSLTITWETTSYPSSEYVNLTLEQDGVLSSTIGTVLNTGSYQLTLPPTLSGTGFKIKAGKSGVYDYSNATFDIAATAPPSVTILYPNGGESLAQGSALTITWQTTSYPATEYLDLTLEQNGAFLSTIGTVLNTGSYNLTLPADLSGTGFKIRAGEGPVFDYSDATFDIAATAPPASPITVLYPNGGETITTGTLLTITWEASSYPASEYVNLTLEKDGAPFTNIGSGLNTGSYQLTVPNGLSGSGYKIKAGAGGIYDYSDSSFSFAAP